MDTIDTPLQEERSPHQILTKEVCPELINQLSYLSANVESEYALGLIDNIDRYLDLFQNNLLVLNNRKLKALIFHDIKVLIYNYNIATEFVKAGKASKVLSSIREAIFKLQNFVNLVRLSLIEEDDENLHLLKVEDLISALADSYEVAEESKSYVSFRVNYYAKKLAKEIVMELRTNIKHMVVNDNPYIVFPMHTILLNMTELGATQVNITVKKIEGYYVIEISDNLEIPDMDRSEMVKFLTEKIQKIPDVNSDTDELVAKGGLSLSNALLNDHFAGIYCGIADERSTMVKCFFIMIPKGRVDKLSTEQWLGED